MADEARPTDNAIMLLDAVVAETNRAMLLIKGLPPEKSALYALNKTAVALQEMSKGLRATYIKLEQVEALLRRQGAK